MKKIFRISLAFTLLLIVLTACAKKDIQKNVSKELKIDVSGGTEISNYDTHSGNGDGTSCVVLEFSDDKILKEIQESSEWKSFPLSETVQALVYGVSDEKSNVGPFLNDNEGNPLVPEIQKGYYLLIDRQVENDKTSGADILHRGSFNFTLGLFDVDTNTLYFCKLDT